MALTRLDKLLANRTEYSRADIKKLLRAGAVQVDGVRECDGGRKIDPDAQTVTCQGKSIRGGDHVYYILNKPMDVVCATEDRDHKTVIDLVPQEMCVRGLFPAGRLDGDSTGLVLLTDDGDLAHRMLSPKSHVPKYYLIRLARPYEVGYAEQLAAGLTLSDGTQCLPAEIAPLDLPGQYAVICLHEGKYHQVKRMMAAMGNHVEHLHRVAVGGLILPPDLPLGGCLEIIHKDVESLLKTGELFAVCERIMSDFSSYSINADNEL